MLCDVCHQPECSRSTSGARPGPGSHATRLEPGQHSARGYGEWVVHPDEAIFVLHRGYAMVNGQPQPVTFIQNEAFVTQIRVEGTSTEVNHYRA